jgi:chemotaxis protein CheC
VTAAEVDLDELELDALTELVNIGVSRAATSLREMVGEQVLLSVPHVALVSRQRAVEILVEREDGKLVAVVTQTQMVLK